QDALAHSQRPQMAEAALWDFTLSSRPQRRDPAPSGAILSEGSRIKRAALVEHAEYLVTQPDSEYADEVERKRGPCRAIAPGGARSLRLGRDDRGKDPEPQALQSLQFPHFGPLGSS